MHSCAINDDGSVWCWGLNQFGALGDGTAEDSHVPVQVTALGTGASQLSLGDFHSCAIKDDGSVWCWGSNVLGQLGDGSTEDSHVPVQVAALGNEAAQLALGIAHSCAIRSDNSLWCWRANQVGQLGDGSMEDSPAPVQVTALGPAVAQVALGGAHSCAIKNDGSLWCWGANAHGQLGNGSSALSQTTPVAIACE